MNVESIAEVKVLVVELPGRVRPVERPADHGGHEERHATGSADRSTTSSATRTGTRTARPNILNGDPKTMSKRARLGLLDRRSDRQAGRQQQAVLLLQPGVRAAHGGQRRAALPRADGARAARATSRRRSTTTATCIRTSGIRVAHRRRCAATNTGGCFADGGVLGKIPANRLYQTGLNILKMYPMPTITTCRPGRPTTTRSPGRPRTLLAWQPAIRVDYQRVAVAARDVQVLRAGRSATRCSTASIPGLQRHEACRIRWSATIAATVNYTPDADDVPRGARTGTARTSWPGARWRRAAPARPSATNALPMNPIGNRITAGLGGIPMLFPDALAAQLVATTPTTCSRAMQPPMWQNGLHPEDAELHLGRPRRQRAAEHPVPRLPQHQRDRRHLDQPDEGRGPAHDQDRLLQHAQLQGAAAGRIRSGRINFTQRHQQPARLAVPVRERGARHLQPVPAAVEVHRGHATSTTTPRRSSRTTGRSTRS